MRATHTEAKIPSFAEAVTCLAGPLAEKRALRGSGPGWVRSRTWEERVAYHEAGHAVAAAACRLYVHSVSIIPDEDSGGRCLSSRSAELPDGPEKKLPPKKRRDHHKAACYAWLLTSFDDRPQWKSALATVRVLRRRTEEILERHWFVVMAVANALEHRKELDRAEIESLVRGKIAA
jgi:hypothetical protein